MSFPVVSKAQRIETLKAVVQALGDALPAKATGSVLDRLADLGEVLRRATLLKPPPGLVEAQLEQVSGEVPAEVLDTLTATLNQAADEAMESFLTEEPAEQLEWRNSAAQALLLRDRMQSVLRALEHRALTNDGFTGQFERFEAALSRIDRSFKPKIRYFIPLNAWRRDERDVLDSGERLTAFWFTARCECDDLLPALSGTGSSTSAHFKSCSQCREDLSVSFAPPLHLTSEIAFELDLGVLPEKVAAQYRAHCARCSPCREVLNAIEAGDRAIEELGSQTPPTGKSARRREEEVLEDAREYRVLLRRREGRVKLLLCPREGGTLSTATLTLPGKRNPIAAHATANGLEFEV
ncbi:MAG: hypothetical protein ACJ790_18210, partial [Myxococcaceae bacterium]